MKGKRIISSLLSMAMVMTLNTGMSFADEVPVTEEPVIEEQVVEEPQVVEETPVIEEEPAAPEEELDVPVVEEEVEVEEENYPAQTFTGTTPDGKITVEVRAGEGALPEGAVMQVENVNKSVVTDLAAPLVGGKIDSLSAVDVIFYNAAGDMIEPLTEIVVNIKTNELEKADSYQLVHIDQANNAERISEDKVIDINNKEATFATDVFSIYVIVAVTETGAIDFDETFGSDHITVHAPDGAFAPGTEMVISSVDDTDKMASIVSKYGQGKECSIKLLDISFYKDGAEVEPALPVEVTWESSLMTGGSSQIIHITNDGTLEQVSADISNNTAVFTAESFSEYGVLQYTQRFPEVEITRDGETYFVFDPSSLDPSSLDPAVTTIKSGKIAVNAPKFENYAFKNATTVVENPQTGTTQTVEVVEVGAFTAYYKDENENETAVYNVYYRTPDSISSSDIIVLLATQQITLHYSESPLKVTYIIRYDGNDYTVVDGIIPNDLKALLGDDADDLVLAGPDSIAKNQQYPSAITVKIPKGFEGRTTINNTNLYGNNDYLGYEPKYSLSSDNKVISRNPDRDVKWEDVYGIRASTTNQTVVLSLTKRNTFKFDASYFLKTVYTGGNGSSFGDSRMSSNTGNKARITTDSGTLNTSTATGTIQNHSYTWSFWTNAEVNDDIPQYNDIWMIDGLEINGTQLNIPYADNIGDTAPATTTLPSGIEVTISLDQIKNDHSGSGRQRHYIITVSNVYQDVVISGGNIVNTASSTEIIPEVLENVQFAFYGYDTGDHANNSSYSRSWQNWTVGPISAAGDYSGYNNKRWYNMYGFNQNNKEAMRFSVPTGYGNPRIAFVSTGGTDLKTNIKTDNGIQLSSTPDEDGYYAITPQPDSSGYYYFGISDFTSNGNIGLLRIKATKNVYGIKYEKGDIADAVDIPDDDHSGYNVEDKYVIGLSKNLPKDSKNPAENVFLYYTIVDDENPTTTHYAPGQKLEGDDFIEFISHAKLDPDTGEYMVTLKANWEKAATVENVWITVDFYLDDSTEPVYSAEPTKVPKDSAVYVDIDSTEMTNFMEKYNWELFYDEMGSDPYIESIQKDMHIPIRCYSKFYVYHSGSGKLELHTTLELKNKKLDLYSSTTPDFLYGGWYTSYAGDTDNLIEKAARKNAAEGELTAVDVSTLSKGGNVLISDQMPKYTVEKAGLYDGAWVGAQTQNGTAVDVPSVQEGGHGTIFYIKEVPTAYLSNYYQVIYNKDTKELTGLYLISAVDDLNYNDTGVIITSNHKATVVKTMTFTRNGKSLSLKANTALANKGIVNQSYLTYVDAKNPTVGVFKTGEFTVLPYWVTPDGILVKGVSSRKVTISSMTKDGISASDIIATDN